MHVKGLPGFRDFYPDDLALLHHITAAWRAVSIRYGFEEYDGPPLEPLELYTEKSGSEIVEQLYHFEDKGGRAVALRPEMTPTLARMVAAKPSAFKKPIRWFAVPQLFRYERQQRGRLREHFQFNLDLLGEPGPLADAEVIAAAIDVMRELGLGPSEVRVRLADRRVLGPLLAAGGVGSEHLGAAFAAIDKIERVAADVLTEQLRGAGLTHQSADHVLTIGRLRGLTAVRETLDATRRGTEAGENLVACHDALLAMGFGDYVDVDLSIVRGLAYYTGIVFELFDADRSFRAICGGGRYDGLLQAVGGVDLPAVGFGMGDVVLGELLRDRGRSPAAAGRLDAFLVSVTSDDVPEVLRLAARLRERGVRVEYALKHQSVGKQLKLAAARPARRAVIVGPEERAAGLVVVRDLVEASEERVDLGRLEAEYPW